MHVLTEALVVCAWRRETWVLGVPAVVQWLNDLFGLCGGTGSIPGLGQWVKDPGLLQLELQLLQLELRYATGCGQKRKKKRDRRLFIFSPSSCPWYAQVIGSKASDLPGHPNQQMLKFPCIKR